MSKPPLPGFFWDEEKQRYFKIGQSKHETPTSAKYTWDNVEKRKRNDDEKQERAKWTKLVATQRLRRSKLLSSPLATIGYGRELGNFPRQSWLMNERARFIGSQCKSRRLLATVLEPKGPLHIGQRGDLENFAYDPVGQVIFVLLHHRRSSPEVYRSTQLACLPFRMSTARQAAFSSRGRHTLCGGLVPYPPTHQLDVAKYTGDYSFVDVPDMTVLRASETEGQCVTSVTGACTGHHYIDLLSPTDLIRPNTDDDEYRYSPHNFGCITDGFEDYDRVALNPFIRHPRYFDGRLEIEHGSFHLQHPGAAVSVGENVFIINMLDSIRGRGAEPRFRVQSEILSLAWLSESLIAVGCRSGSIYVFYTGSMRRVFSFRHVDLDHKPAAAAALRRADGSGLRLVVAGFPNAVALYDIRLRRSNQQPLLVHYRDYVNAADPDVTMDVAGDASKGQPGLVAVTSGNRFVNIYAMMSGELLRRVDFKVVMADPSLRILGHAEGRSRRIRMKSLKFVDMEQDAEDWKGDSVWSEEWTHDCGEETECDRKSVRRYGPEETWEGADEDERMYDGGVGTVGRRFGSGRLLAGCDKGIIEIAW